VTRLKYFDKFKVCYKQAALSELVAFNPLLFENLTIKKEKSNRTRLTNEEIKKFKYSIISDPVNDFYRKLFFFQLNTGLYYSDLCLLKVKHVGKLKMEEGGKTKEVYFLENTRSKNEETFTIRIFPDAMKILNELSTFLNGKPDDLLFPKLISSQKYNDRLKKIAQELNIDKSLSNKVARHTFGLWMVSIGNTREKVGKSMGHTDDSTTLIYSELDTAGTLQKWIEPEI
jgi:integrase